MRNLKRSVHQLHKDFLLFLSELTKFLIKVFRLQFYRFETGKGIFVTTLYRQRGKMAGKLIHSGMAGLTAFGVMIAPIVAQEFPGRSIDPWEIPSPSAVLAASTSDPGVTTSISDKGRTEIIQYQVQDGDTVSSIAQKFGISTDTIMWQNNLSSKDAIRLGQTLQILPVDGVLHKVQKGDTIYSISKKYDVDPQEIISFPFNTFVNDETFELAIGQTIIVPHGVMPAPSTGIPAAPRAKQVTPDAGTVVATGSFAWPTNGIITQRYSWYHKAIDIANRAAPSILAADAGKVIAAGWNSTGYGNHVIIDHNNGYRTLYGHMSQILVTVGQTVNRGDKIGVMGSTGRSTGTHLHFEVIQNGVHINPLGVLR
jgi:murein DD-endopeptidase MepM/ murein hydrolase activator NlpD